MGEKEQLLAIVSRFPNSNMGNISKTSEATNIYNCIAWAVGDQSNWWQPNKIGGFWPFVARKDFSVMALIEAYESLGFFVCHNGNWEDGFEKVALFSKDQKVYTHASKQVSENNWSSKIGEFIDISHSLEALEDGPYGRVVAFMKRQTIVAIQEN